jgi:hypothetical protein
MQKLFLLLGEKVRMRASNKTKADCEETGVKN